MHARAHSTSTATALSMPPGRHGPAEIAVAAHLLGHGEDLEAGFVGPSRLEDGGILGDGVEVDHGAVGRDRPRLMQGDRLFDQGRIAPPARISEKHRNLPRSDPGRAISRLQRRRQPPLRVGKAACAPQPSQSTARPPGWRSAGPRARRARCASRRMQAGRREAVPRARRIDHLRPGSPRAATD